MPLQFYDSLQRRKVAFVPLDPPRVGIYVCGLTVYDFCHIGHARMLVAFDVIVRHLRASGYDVTFVRNITDIDDKIIARAAENGESIEALTSRFINAMHEDCARLGVLPPDVEPKATGAIDGMVSLIQELERRGLAYAGENGDVYYRVRRFDAYGALSGKNPDDLRAGTRVEVDEHKEDSLDFVLWKAAKPGEPAWPSPWGHGRPGWHIECSAMSEAHLGTTFDIHGGGMDLKFPHHENEIAQSCGARGDGFARHWLHNGFVNVDDEKMSKSLGNFFTIRDVLKVYRPEELRFFLMGAHYRKPINYSDDELDQARAGLRRLYIALCNADQTAPPSQLTALADLTSDTALSFRAAMDDDFNTPGAIAVLFDLARQINRAADQDRREDAAELALELRSLGHGLGLLAGDANAYLKSAGGADATDGLTDDDVDTLVAARNAARAQRDFTEADRIRDELVAARIELCDGADGTTWQRR
ncbi:MAG: cysteine--tRNA ligase [Pseudomonadota bacterium]